MRSLRLMRYVNLDDTDFGVHSVASENVKSENGTY
jgi:hypothetical protein